MIRLFTLVAASFALLALTLVGARIAGANSTSPALAVLDVSACSQPCWHDIRPGITTFEQARSILLADATLTNVAVEQHTDDNTLIRALCWQGTVDNTWRGCAFNRNLREPVGTIDLFIELKPPSGSLRLGDAIALFGEPVDMTLCTFGLGDLMGTLSNFSIVSFQGNVVVWLDPPKERRWDPSMIVRSVYYVSPGGSGSATRVGRWRGFARLEKPAGCS